MTATSGRRLSEPFTKSDPLGSLARTLLESSRWFSPARRLKWEAVPLFSARITYTERSSNTSSKPSAKTSGVKDIPSSRLLFRLVPSERPIGGTACGLLPTVQTQGLKRCNAEGKTEFMPLDLLPIPTSIDRGSGRINKSPSPGAKERPTIALAAKMGLLPTPMSTDIHHAKRVKELKAAGGDTFHSRANGETRPNGLTDFLDFNGLLPTPRANKVNGLDLNNEALANRDKGNLEEAVAKIVTSCQPTDGQASQLNPLFVTEMMGFPSDWLVSPFQSGGQNPSKP